MTNPIKLEKRANNEVLSLLNSKRFPRERFEVYELLYGYVYTYHIGDEPEENFATKEEIRCKGLSNEEIEIFYQKLVDTIYLYLLRSNCNLHTYQIGYLILALDMLEAFKKDRKGKLQLPETDSSRVQYVFEIYIPVRYYYEHNSDEGHENPLEYGKIFIELLKKGEK